MSYVHISVKMPPDLVTRLEQYASAHNMTRSEAIRRAIELMLELESKRDENKTAKVEKIRLF